MKVLLVSHSDGGGGAGRAAHRLLRSLRSDGVEATLAGDSLSAQDPDVIPLGGPFDRRVRLGIEQLADKIVRPRDASNFSAAASGALTPRLVRRTGASVINVHWTGYGAASIAQMGGLNAPAVWTMHDMWTLGGGEHYYNPGDERANGSWVLDRKERHWRQPRLLITPSTWLREQAAKSPIVSHWPIRVIPNPLDLTIFTPQNSSAAKLSLGLDPLTPVVLFALTNNLSDQRKGADLLVEALHTLHTRWPTGQQHPHVAILGHEGAPMSWTGLPFDTHWLGRTFDDEHIALSYAAADVIVVPSRMDNLPQVATEAAACGRPVVAFDIGGLSDAVEDRRSGYLARPENAEDLATGLLWVLSTPDKAQQLGHQARQKAEREWSFSRISGLYQEAFLEVIEGSRS